MKKPILYFALIIAFVSCKTSQDGEGRTEPEIKSTSPDAYFEELKSIICDNVIVIAENEFFSDVLYSKISELLLVECQDDEIRMIFKLEDEGRMTLSVSLFQSELLLKHDVRDKNLAPADVTMFGGFLSEISENNTATFESHKFGMQTMWPGYEDVSWELHLSKDSEYIIYRQKKNNDTVLEILFSVID